MEIEIEIKQEKSLMGNVGSFECAQCGETATRIVVIGRVQDIYGQDYEICGSDRCEDRALDDYIKVLTDPNRKRDYLANKADMEGK